MTPLPPVPQQVVYQEDRMMAGSFDLMAYQGPLGAAVLLGGGTQQFFTPDLFAGVTGAVGPLVDRPGGMALLGPTLGWTFGLSGPWRGTLGYAMYMGMTTGVGNTTIVAAPNASLAYSFGNSSRCTLTIAPMLPFGGVSTTGWLGTVSFSTRHGLPYRQDPAY